MIPLDPAMITPSYCRAMAAYNRWMNARLYALCAELSDAERKRDRGAFFRSIHGTLNHLLYGDRSWMSRFLGRDLGWKGPADELYADYGELHAARQALDNMIIDWAAALSERWLRADVTYTSKIDGRVRTFPAWLLVTHMFNHQTHHRGQLTTLLSQLGLDPGVTDLPWLPELAELTATGSTSPAP
jgi:uncharacterized damage-inducible protein DinB